MKPLIWLTLLKFFMFLPLSVWSQHQISTGMNYTLLRVATSVPKGNGVVGRLHVADGVKVKMGMSVGYRYLLSFSDNFYFSVGLEGVQYRGSMEYSSYFFGQPCSSCNTFTRSDRIGLEATYSNWYLSIPVSFYIPLTGNANWYLQVGVDGAWNFNEGGNWKYVEIDVQFDKLANGWISKRTQGRVAQAKLPVKTIEQGIQLGVGKKFFLDKKFIFMELRGRIALGKMSTEPDLRHYNFMLVASYWLGK